MAERVDVARRQVDWTIDLLRVNIFVTVSFNSVIHHHSAFEQQQQGAHYTDHRHF